MILIRIAINLFGMVMRLLVYPLFLLRKHAFSLLILIGVLYVISTFVKDDSPAISNQSSVTGGLPPASGTLNGVNPVLKFEDGNSVFSDNLLKRMNKDQAAYYSRIFYGVMAQIGDGSAYPWQQGDMAGSITPSATFKNGRGGTCRKFKEILKVGTVQQNLTGQACHRGDGSWCKLKLSATPACGLHSKPGLFEGLTDIF